MRKNRLEYIERTGVNAFRKPIAVICVETGKSYLSMRTAAKAVGVTHRTVSYVCSGIDYTAGGDHWRLA